MFAEQANGSIGGGGGGAAGAVTTAERAGGDATGEIKAAATDLFKGSK